MGDGHRLDAIDQVLPLSEPALRRGLEDVELDLQVTQLAVGVDQFALGLPQSLGYLVPEAFELRQQAGASLPFTPACTPSALRTATTIRASNGPTACAGPAIPSRMAPAVRKSSKVVTKGSTSSSPPAIASSAVYARRSSGALTRGIMSDTPGAISVGAASGTGQRAG